MTRAKHANDFDWSETNIRRLKQCISDGLSCSEIGAELGTTRNAVIGKVHRLGLATARRPGRTAPREIKIKTRREPPVPKRYRRNFTPLAPRAATMAERIQARVLDLNPTEIVNTTPRHFDMDIPVEQRCTLMQLNDSKCRWPIGEVGTPDFYFCGAIPVEGLPYCACHSRIAYRPAIGRTAVPASEGTR